MSNNLVDIGDDYQDKPEVEKKDQTLAACRIRSDAVPFFKRMIQYFYESRLINEPKLSLLAKACLNIMAHKYAKQEEINLASYIQRNLVQSRELNVVYVPQMQREMSAQGQAPRNPLAKTARDLIPARLRRDPPLDPVQEPEWVQGW